MNKIIKLLGIVLVLITCGCGKKNYILCTNKVYNDLEGYNLNATYKIFYDKSFVTKIEKVEKYSSSNSDVLDYFEEYKDSYYNNFNDIYGGTIYEIVKDKDSVEIKTTIDLHQLDVKEMVRNGELDKDYVVSNQFTKSGAINYYKNIGATCSEGE